MSNARVLASRLQTKHRDLNLKSDFATVTKSNSGFADTKSLIIYLEDLLEVDISETDANRLLEMMDIDGDGQISQEDFISFLTGRRVEAPILESGNGDAIVDIHVSTNPLHIEDFRNHGYELVQLDGPNSSAYDGTFGKGQCLWIWRKSQGTCSGRLKPIIDIQIDASRTSSVFVLSGYTCVPIPLNGGQWVWIKRASTEEEEKDSIVDLKVTQGRMRDTSDIIWRSPGAGWARVDGNFTKGIFSYIDSFVWFRPLRDRPIEKQLTSPVRQVVALSDETRLARLLTCVRSALRHYVPVVLIKKLANVQLEDSSNNENDDNDENNNNYRFKELRFYFSEVFHMYDGSKNRLKIDQFAKLLYDVGLRVDGQDIPKCFKYFNIKHDGKLTVTEYSQTLTLTDYELDLLVDLIRSRLYTASNSIATDLNVDPNRSKGTNEPEAISNAGAIFKPVKITKCNNKLRESRIFVEIFKMINENVDGILTINEIIDLCAKMEIFITEEEARKLARMMDSNGNEKIEEVDFISFMQKESDVRVKKAHRLHDASEAFRRWLIRGNSTDLLPGAGRSSIVGFGLPRPPPSTNTGNTIHLSDYQWQMFKQWHESIDGSKFRGFIDSEVLILHLASLDFRLSRLEARELALIIGPEKFGKLQREDFDAYINRTCRSFGELMAILSREHLENIYNTHLKQVESKMSDGIDDVELLDQFEDLVESLTRTIHSVPSTGNLDYFLIHRVRPEGVVSLMQLKTGIESMLRGANHQTVNLEEWASLACLFGADVAEEDSYGVHAEKFIRGFCEHSILGIKQSELDSDAHVDNVCKELARMIREEARALRANGVPDFQSVFNLFDTNKSGEVSVDEFREMLKRFLLLDSLAESRVPQVLARFDKSKKGSITFQDFFTFLENHKDPFSEMRLGVTDDALIPEDAQIDGVAFDDDDDDDFEDIQSSIPPSIITRNSDCDWMLWHLWRQCIKSKPSNPEGVVVDLQAAFSETELVRKDKNVSVNDVWMILQDKRLIGKMSKAQYFKSIPFFVMDNMSDGAEVDFDALIRYILRSGKAFTAELQARKAVDVNIYKELRTKLKKEFKAIKSPEVGVPKYEKIFRKFDTDGDGCITMEEFKLGLKRMKVKDYKLWTRKMVRHLFEELDTNHDNVVSVKELSAFLREADQLPDEPDETKLEKWTVEPVHPIVSEEDGLLFRVHTTVNETLLFRKLSDLLTETVAIVGADLPTGIQGQLENVRTAVHRFFKRYDPADTGLVTDEVYRNFIRKSGLQEGLAARELRHLHEKIRRTPANLAESNHLYMIDYRALINAIGLPADSIPHSRGHEILQKLQRAADQAAMASKRLSTYCVLLDDHSDGAISTEAFMHACKMIGCRLTNEDVTALKEIMPNHVFHRDGRIRYREFIGVMHGNYHGDTNALDNKPIDNFDATDRHATLSRTGARVNWNAATKQTTDATNIYYHGDTNVNNNRDNWNAANNTVPFNRSFQSEAGASRIAGAKPKQATFGNVTKVNASLEEDMNDISNIAVRSPIRGNGSMLDDTFYEGNDFRENFVNEERFLSTALDKIHSLFDSCSPNTVYRKFSSYDVEGEGFISWSSFQRIIRDMNPHIVVDRYLFEVLMSNFGNIDQSKLNYVALLATLRRHIEGRLTPASNPFNFNFSSNNISNMDLNHSIDNDAQGLDDRMDENYTGMDVLDKYNKLLKQHKSPRLMFEVFDDMRVGKVRISDFERVIKSTKLLNPRQTDKVIRDYRDPINRDMINYDDFCRSLEVLSNTPVLSFEPSSPKHVNGSGRSSQATRPDVAKEEPEYRFFDDLDDFPPNRHFNLTLSDPTSTRSADSWAINVDSNLNPSMTSASTISRYPGSNKQTQDWTCSVCSWKNRRNNRNCEICDLSRPMSEFKRCCNRCQYYNSEDASVCTMCASRLN